MSTDANKEKGDTRRNHDWQCMCETCRGKSPQPPLSKVDVKLESSSSPFPTVAETIERRAVARKEEYKRWEKKVADAISERLTVNGGETVYVNIPFSIAYEDLLTTCKTLVESGYEVKARDEHGQEILLLPAEQTSEPRRSVYRSSDSLWEVVVGAYENAGEILSRKMHNGSSNNNNNREHNPGGTLYISIPRPAKKAEEEKALKEKKKEVKAPIMVETAMTLFKDAPLYHLFLLLLVSSTISVITRLTFIHQIVVTFVGFAFGYRMYRWATTKTTTTDANALLQEELRVMRVMRDDMKQLVTETRRVKEERRAKETKETKETDVPLQQQQQQPENKAEKCDHAHCQLCKK